MPIERRAVLGLLGAGMAMAPAGFARASAEARAGEVAAYRRFAEATHPLGLKAAQDPEWMRRAEALARECEGLSPEAYAVRMLHLAAWFEDGHTDFSVSELKAGAFASRFPCRASAFHDGLFVTSAAPVARALLGARVERIAGKDVGAVLRSFADIWPANNVSAIHRASPELLRTPGLLRGMGMLEGPLGRIPIEAVTATGEPVRVTVDASGPDVEMEAITITPGRIAAWRLAETSGNFIRPLSAERALFVSFDDLGVPAEEALAFTAAIRTAMADTRSDRLILDLRRNGGGSNYSGEALRREIARSRFNRPGGLYVLTSGATFSAAQNLCTRLERETFAIFVGEPTGGTPNHYGDAAPFTGAATGMRGRVSTLPWLDSYPADKRRWIMPDLPAPQRFADWAAGRDVALERALGDPTDAPPEEISRDRILFYERASQAVAWKPFWL